MKHMECPGAFLGNLGTGTLFFFFFFSSLRTTLPCVGTNPAVAEIYGTHLHPPLLVWWMAIWSIHDAKFGL